MHTDYRTEKWMCLLGGKKKNLFIVLVIIVGEIQHYASTQTFRNRQFLDPYAVLHDDIISSFVLHKI